MNRDEHLPGVLPHRVLCGVDVVRDGARGDAAMTGVCGLCGRPIPVTPKLRLWAHLDRLGELCWRSGHSPVWVFGRTA